MVEDGHGYESGKPEEHGDHIEAQHNEWMVKLPIHYSRREGEVEDDEDGPNGAEELERILRRGIAIERGRDCTLSVCVIGRFARGVDVPWPVRPRTTRAKRNWTAQMPREIISSMVGVEIARRGSGSRCRAVMCCGV